MAFYNTYVNYNGNGSQQDFSVPFSYLSQSEVIVTFSGVGTYTYVFTSPNVIRTTPAVASGDSIRISRNTSLTSPKTVFSNGSALTAAALNAQINQLLYGIQEFSDTATGALNKDTDGNWTATNKRIKNLSTPLSTNDAVTKAYVDSLALGGGTISSSITKVIVTRSGTGSQTTFSLPFAPTESDFINVFISGVYQASSTFSISGSSIVFTSAPANGTNNIEIQIIRLLGAYVNQTVDTAQITNGAVTTAKIADSNVTTAKIANSAVTIEKVGASGTPNNSTYLRGDGAWASIPAPSENFKTQLFTSTGSWTAPAGCTSVRVRAIGAGGGGAQFTAAAYRGGFGGAVLAMATVTPGQTYTVTVGVGGTGSNTANGTAGTDSSFGSIVTATGGQGATNTAAGTNGTGSVGAGGTLLRSGNVETNGAYISTAAGPAIASPFIGALRAATASATAPVVFDPAIDLGVGSGGAGETGASNNNATGGVGGLVYLEWVE